MILAIDPGTTESGFVLFNGKAVIEAATRSNDDMLAGVEAFACGSAVDQLAIEMVASYGMAVGAEVFETVRWIGRFQDRWEKFRKDRHSPAQLIYRRDVKMHLCGSARAKDGNIRQALIDKVGPPGTKKNPGATYGVRSHCWAALAVAITVLETESERLKHAA